MAGIAVDQTACIRCGACIDVCQIASVYEMRDDAIQAVRPDACWRCGQCVAVCPTDAIDHDDFPLDESPMLDPKAAPTVEQLTLLLRSRRSNRTYSEQTVDRNTVRELIDTARWVPSAMNNQALDWVALDDKTRIAKLAKLTIDKLRRLARWVEHPLVRPFLPLLVGRDKARAARGSKERAEALYERWAQGQDPVFYNAPVVLIGHTQKANLFGRDDAVYGTYNIMLAAGTHGLATCQIGLLQILLTRSARLRRKAGVPEDRTPQVVLILGYPRNLFRRLPERRRPLLEWNPR